MATNSYQMADISRIFDVEKPVSFDDDLMQLLENEKQINYLKNCVDQLDRFRSRIRSDHAGIQSSLEGYKKKIDMCKQKTETIKAEVASDADIHLLQKELDDELQRETLLQEELTITIQIKDFEEQRSFIEEKMQKKLEQYEKNPQAKLSVYAFVSSIIPDINEQSQICGHIVYKEKKVVEKLELNSRVMSNFDTCNAIWKMII